jgi:predicted RecA/RadA family phage recombinase
MAKNMIQKEGKYISLSIASKLSGDPALVGNITGVCLTDTDSAGKVSLDLGPAVYDLSVAAIDGSGNSAVGIGDKLYYVQTDTPKLNKKTTGTFFGYALEAITSGSTDTINVLKAAP